MDDRSNTLCATGVRWSGGLVSGARESCYSGFKPHSTLVANELVSACELHPCCKRVTSTRKKSDDPRTDPMTMGADSDLPGWQPIEKAASTAKAGYDCFNNATSLRRPEAVGWAPSVWQAR